MALFATYTRLKDKIQTTNLFEDIEKTEEENFKNQRISTWIFLVLLVLSIFTLLAYASLTSVTKTMAIYQPQIIVYKHLQSKYPNTLVCPCQQILNEYSTFIVSFTAKFNQICSSDFVSEQWLNYVNYRLLPQMEYHYTWDFRHTAYSFFQMLNTLCTLVSQTINDQLIEFYSTTLLTENLVSEETFLATILASKDQFINTTTSSFQTSLRLLRTIIQGNNLANRLGTNYGLQTTYDYYGEWDPISFNSVYPPDGCSCQVSSYCNTTTGIFSVVYAPNVYNPQDYPYMQGMISHEVHLMFRVPGINVACLILDAVLQSNLSCLYSSSCLSQLNTYLTDSLHPFNATALNVSYSSVPTVSNLVDKLMVDEWLFNSSYEFYFSQCNPSTCTYTYTQQFDVLFIITTVMGFIGGIVTILMLVTLPLVTFTRRFAGRRRRLSITQHEIDPENSRPLRQHFQTLLPKIKDFLRTLNSFKDPEKQSAHDLRNQCIATRLFIILMIITLSILVLYSSVTIITQTVTVHQPTVNDYNELQTKYSQTLVCPCTQTTIDYEQFISFHPTFHQICSSNFTTTQWLNSVKSPIYVVPPIFDFRAISQSYFSTLSAFCNISAETINNALLVFNSTKYVTKNVQKTDLFQSETNQIVNLFKQTTTNFYLQALSMDRQILSGNALFSGLLTNYYFSTVADDSLDQVFIPKTYTTDDSGNGSTNCSCKSYPDTCGKSAGIYTLAHLDPTLLFPIPGFWVGCYIIESLFGSTFECYFSQSCLNQIRLLLAPKSHDSFKAIAMIYNSSNTRYQIRTKVHEIIEQLMIEQWNNQISFNLYYEQCNPLFCLYTYNKQGDLAYIFTTTIALIGGLTAVFKIIVPLIVAFIRRKKRPQPIQTEVDGHEHAPNFVRKYNQILKNYIITLNLFKNPNNRSSEHIQYQHLSTRIFVTLFSISFMVLLVYVSLENVTQTMTVRNSSINQLDLLYQKYPNSLRCSCKTLSIQYQTFIRFDPQFHPICASDFVTSKTWLEIDYPSWKFDNYGHPTFHTNIDDFRQIISQLFQLFTSFCQVSLQTLNTELLAFNFTTFITPNLLSRQQFNTQTSKIISQFIANTARSFLYTVRLVNNMTSANMLISALSSDSVLTNYPQYSHIFYNFYYSSYNVYDAVYDQRDQEYNSSLTGSNCDCQKNPFCIQQAIVYDIDATTKLFPVPGIYVGCYLVEALLQSDLRCFYDDLCLQQLLNSLNLSENTAPLSNSISLYQVTTTLQEIISNLMIEQWNNQTFYQDYFNQCQPEACTVTYVQRGNVPYIITTMTGLIGGLTKVYMFAVPLLVKLIYPFIIRLKRKKLINIKVVPIEATARPTCDSV